MAKRGPKKKTLNRASSKGSPKPPKGLDPESRRHWVKLAKLLDDSGQGSQLDIDAFTYYIHLRARWMKAEAELAKPPADDPKSEGGGIVITTINGYRQLNPWYTVAKESLKELKSYLGEFGLSPKARASLKAPEVEEIDDKWADFEE